VFRASVFRVMQNPERNRGNNTAIQLFPDYVFSCISDTSQPDSLPGNICQGPKRSSIVRLLLSARAITKFFVKLIAVDGVPRLSNAPNNT
ncbi:hypothetical protein, partial [Alistipes putredinis]|uniref:hypothetical protein n=1 Tax=Alistipes putredinis TaxID=28117 RepID=UPI003AB6F7F4